MNYQEENARTIDRWVAEGWEWGVPVTAKGCGAAGSGGPARPEEKMY